MSEKRFELRPEHLPRLVEALRESLVAGRLTTEQASDWCDDTYDVLLEHRVKSATRKGPDPHSPTPSTAPTA